MELREWLIILGLALVTLIVIDGVRRLQRQRRVPRLDQVDSDATDDAVEPAGDPDAEARAAEINWELPNGGARVVRPAEEGSVRPKPKLERQEHPGPSRVLSEFRRHAEETRSDGKAERADARPSPSVAPTARPEPAGIDEVPRTEVGIDPDTAAADDAVASRSESSGVPQEASERPAARDRHADAEAEEGVGPLAADPEDHEGYADEERYRLVDLEGMGDSLKSGSKRVGSSMQRFGASLQKSLHDRREHKRDEKQRREQARAEKAAREAAQRQQAEERRAAQEAERRRHEAEAAAEVDDDPLFASSSVRPPAAEPAASMDAPGMDDEAPRDDVVRAHPVLERALRHDVNAEHARETLSHAEEILVISVMARDEEGFSGTALLELMMACGLRYGRDMGIFHRFETEDPESRLQFSMVNVVKPGTFPIEAMDDFRTQGITLLMPLPGASDTAAAFEAMVETAMVIVRHLGGVLKDEHQSVMTAQTVEFARQRVQEFERRNRLNRYQVN